MHVSSNGAQVFLLIFEWGRVNDSCAALFGCNLCNIYAVLIRIDNLQRFNMAPTFKVPTYLYKFLSNCINFQFMDIN